MAAKSRYLTLPNRRHRHLHRVRPAEDVVVMDRAGGGVSEAAVEVTMNKIIKMKYRISDKYRLKVSNKRCNYAQR